MNARLATAHVDVTRRDKPRFVRSDRHAVALQRLVHDAVQLQTGEMGLDEFRQRADVTLTWLEMGE